MQIRNIMFLLLAGLVIGTGCANSVESAGGKAGDFSLQDTNNRTVRLSDYQGKVVMLNFFATWCPPCREEIPDLIELYDEYKGDGFVVLGISLDKGGAETVKEFAAQYNINYPVLLDDGFVSKAYGPIRSIPTTFIIDRNKNIVDRIIGGRNKDFFESKIKPYL